VVSSIYGRGTLLIGPLLDERGGRLPGGVAMAPPGVFLRTDEACSEPLSRAGWRLAVWSRGVQLDQHRPIGHESLSLGEAAEYVRVRTPRHVEWMRLVVRAQMDVMLGLTRPDFEGRLPAAADRACLALRALAEESAGAFGDRRELDYVESQMEGDRVSLQAAIDSWSAS
jgi:hypothetical protein